DLQSWFSDRDEIQSILADHLRTRTTQEWLRDLEPAGIWCADVFDYAKLVGHEAYRVLKMDQTVDRHGTPIRTTRCPIRIDGEPLFSDKAAPRPGEDNAAIETELFERQNIKPPMFVAAMPASPLPSSQEPTQAA